MRACPECGVPVGADADTCPNVNCPDARAGVKLARASRASPADAITSAPPAQRHSSTSRAAAEAVEPTVGSLRRAVYEQPLVSPQFPHL